MAQKSGEIANTLFFSAQVLSTVTPWKALVAGENSPLTRIKGFAWIVTDRKRRSLQPLLCCPRRTTNEQRPTNNDEQSLTMVTSDKTISVPWRWLHRHTQKSPFFLGVAVSSEIICRTWQSLRQSVTCSLWTPSFGDKLNDGGSTLCHSVSVHGKMHQCVVNDDI